MPRSKSSDPGVPEKTQAMREFSASDKLRLEKRLKVSILPQPNETTCGPTCLQAVYRYYGDNVDLQQLINEVPALAGGGTLAVFLACHALRRGYSAKIFTYNLQIFDPTWFRPGVRISERLRKQMAAKNDPKLHIATLAYMDYLSLGGELRFEEMSPALLRKYLNRGVPILTGLSATYLYNIQREHPFTGQGNDIRGEPSGHFVVLSGYDRRQRSVLVSDPYLQNPMAEGQEYLVGIERLISSILLGIVTYDANLLVIEKRCK
jgi:hypothetical protein